MRTLARLALAPRPRLPLAAASRRLASASDASVASPSPSGSLRSPERTAELERLAEEHNGFLFGEVPLPEGQARVREDWEYTYIPLMTSAFVLYGIAYYFRPHSSIDEWARQEAVLRLAKAEAEANAEEDE